MTASSDVTVERFDDEKLVPSMFGWLIRAYKPIRWPTAAAIIMITLTGCAGGEDSGGRRALTVFAAASLTEAFTELAATFEGEHPGSSLALNFDGSQRLRFQLEHGAQADVFASADQKQMDRARESGLLAGEDVEFTSNSLVLIVPKVGTATELVDSLSDLSRKGVKLALAQPEVPAGRYSRIAIQRLAADPRFGPEYARQVLANLVTEEPNVRNVLQKVGLGEVDAGLVYYSDVQVASDISVIQVPDEANVVASYAVAALKNSDQPEAADAFIDFVLSGTGQEILRNHGFGAPEQALRSLHPNSTKAGAAELTDAPSSATIQFRPWQSTVRAT